MDGLININGDNVQVLEILFLTTIITLLPSLLVMMTSFTRYVISLSFLRTAMGTQQTPPNLVLVGIALFLTLFTMGPVLSQIKTQAYDPYVDGAVMAEKGVEKVDSVLELCSQADYLTVHTPLTAETKGIVGAKELAAMKDGSIVVNCARGGVVDEAAARDALASGKLAGLSMDVLANELAGTGLGDNAGLNSDLFGMKGFTVSPHIGGSTHEAYDGIGAFIVEKAAEFYGLKK